MIELEVDLQLTDDIEEAVTSVIHRQYSHELELLQTNLRHEWRSMIGYGLITIHYGDHLYSMINCLTNNGQSALGLMLAGQPVMLKVGECSIVRNTVLCNVLTLLIPLLPDDLLSSLFCSWAQSSLGPSFQRALCEYYLHASRCITVRGSLLTHWSGQAIVGREGPGKPQSSDVCFPFEGEQDLVRKQERTLEGLLAERIQQDASREKPVELAFPAVETVDRSSRFLCVLFRMLVADGGRYRWLIGASDRGEHELFRNKHFRLQSMKLVSSLVLPLDTESDISSAVWYLSETRLDDFMFKAVAKAFATALTMGEGVDKPQSAFVDILYKKPCELLNAMTPNKHCPRCDGDDTYLYHTGGGCGSRELVACLLPVHALQLLELLMFTNDTVLLFGCDPHAS